MRREFVTESEEETLELGRKLAGEISAPQLLLLIGKLGSGKTTLAKGIVSGLGVASEEEVTSPSFTLVHEYGRHPRVFHVDLYRVDTPRQVETLGLEDLWEHPAVVLVEWGEKIEQVFAGPRWEVHLENLGGDRRRIIVEDFDGQPGSHQPYEN